MPPTTAVSSGSRRDRLSRQLKAVFRQFAVPGAAVVIRAGGKSHLWCLGTAGFEPATPVTAGTLFSVGSVTKPLVATTLAQLVAEGLMAWDDPLIRYVPELGYPDAAARPLITLRHCLAMGLGLERGGFAEWGADPAVPLAVWLQRLRHATLSQAPGVGFSYSNVGPSAVALAIARATGSPFVDVLRRRVFPLNGAHGVSAGAAAAVAADRADQHLLHGGRRVRVLPPFSDTSLGGTGAYLSAAGADEFLSGQLGDVGDGLLGETHRAHVDVPCQAWDFSLGPGRVRAVSYGLGWFCTAYGGHRVLRHAGAELGANAHVLLIPEAGVGAMVMTNSSSPAADVAAHCILDLLLGLPPVDWASRARASEPSPGLGTLNLGRRRKPPGAALAGHYRCPLNGPARIRCTPGRLHLSFADAARFSGVLKPRAAGEFLLRPDDPSFRGLGARLRVLDGGDGFRLAGFGVWRRAHSGSPHCTRR